jgi:predicted aldo/keto reductase-like oxidoreductase
MEHYELAMKPGGQYEGLLRCKDEGLIDHIVVSTHQPGHEVRQILSRDEFEGVLLGVNVLNFAYRWDGLVAAAERGVGVVAMNPLAGGIIPQFASELGFLAAEGETPVHAALRFNIACPKITVSLVGFTTREQVDQACAVADTAEPMSDTELDRLRVFLGENMNEVCTGCGYCKGCPQEIPIPSYMQYYNSKVMFGRSDEEMRKGLAGEHTWGILVGRQAEAEACVECGICEEKCTQHLPIISRLREIAGWEAALRQG